MLFISCVSNLTIAPSGEDGRDRRRMFSITSGGALRWHPHWRPRIRRWPWCDFKNASVVEPFPLLTRCSEPRGAHSICKADEEYWETKEAPDKKSSLNETTTLQTSATSPVREQKRVFQSCHWSRNTLKLFTANYFPQAARLLPEPSAGDGHDAAAPGTHRFFHVLICDFTADTKSSTSRLNVGSSIFRYYVDSSASILGGYPDDISELLSLLTLSCGVLEKLHEVILVKRGIIVSNSGVTTCCLGVWTMVPVWYRAEALEQNELSNPVFPSWEILDQY